MMDHFKVCYIPGGMGLNHSSWWLCERKFIQGIMVDIRIKYMRKADYK